MAIKKGDFIRLSFTGKLEDGSVFDTTDEAVAKKQEIFDEDKKYEPMTIIVGSGFLVEGLEEDLIGKKAGDKAVVTVPPEKGYGERSLDAIEIVSTKKFEGKIEPGQMVEYNGKVGFIESISGGRVKVDYNAPLAGKKLTYEYKIEEIIEDREEKIKALLKGYVSEDAEFKLKEDTIKIEVPKELSMDESWIVGKALIARFLVGSAGLKKVIFRETFTEDDFKDEDEQEE
ncbi:FKBP-type peptidyl-prolyl cis-trans isomerase [Methanocella sp. MCL-LM]|uniref:FKBP-type peptidyl-prolyl cis-trans isomerase n=1 Tax=Methanocella sp. MCL-LM TaxID=3412035 RepID=UPI003C77E961